MTLSLAATSNDACEYVLVVLYTHMDAMIFTGLASSGMLQLTWLALDSFEESNMKEHWYLWVYWHSSDEVYRHPNLQTLLRFCGVLSFYMVQELRSSTQWEFSAVIRTMNPALVLCWWWLWECVGDHKNAMVYLDVMGNVAKQSKLFSVFTRHIGGDRMCR